MNNPFNGRDDGGDDDDGGADDVGGDVGGEDDDEFLVSKLCTRRSFPLLRQLLLSVIITPPSLISLTAGEKQPELKSNWHQDSATSSISYHKND